MSNFLSTEANRNNINTDKLNEAVQRLAKSQECTKKLVANNQYILWLESFTKMHPSFSDDEWDFYPIKISEQEYNNVKLLSNFFDGILNYMQKNYIYPNLIDSGESIFLYYNEIGYEIGYKIGQGSYHFCNRVPINDTKIFIDFNDVISNKIQPNTELFTVKLNSLSTIIQSLITSNVPKQAIIDIVEKTLTKH